MALTHSGTQSLGMTAPPFRLWNPLLEIWQSLDQLRGEKATVIMFICNHCPYVKHILPGLVAFARNVQNDQVKLVAINANDVSQYPEDHPDKMRRIAQAQHFPFPYLYDETQAVARAYGAQCTPDFYVFDQQLMCVYRGQMDDARPGNDLPVTGSDLRAAIDFLISGQPVPKAQKPSIGCGIKWKSPS
ncbi:MAG: thioredoxin family protein [Acidobacteria bacterium]|nr:thioredoxin family protein [Acidobacteriota bacterium]MCB9398188.1 thioredoxin family protein [Acidobacteriota bacterium]